MSPSSSGPELRTERLLLRRWRGSDREPFAALNADPEVMRFLQGPRSRERSDASIEMFEQGFAERGWGLWAVEVVDSTTFIGYVGLASSDFDAPFTPAIEVGWRLARTAWGHGYATEAAKAALRFGLGPTGLTDVMSWTATINLASRGVMDRLGMRRDPDGDFEHPKVPPGDPVRPHVLYRLTPEARSGLLAAR